MRTLFWMGVLGEFTSYFYYVFVCAANGPV